MANFNLIELRADLFLCPKDNSMCHCVAADMRMGKGIAIQFLNKFGQVDKLKNQNVKPGGVAVLQEGQRFIYYLVTKQSSWGKPTYVLLHSSLHAMRQHMISHQVSKLALPRIGCGLDGLQWDKVKDLIYEIFQNDNIQFNVYNFVPTAQK